MSDYPLSEAGPVVRTAPNAKYPWAQPGGMAVETEFPVPDGENKNTRAAATEYAKNHPGCRFAMFTRNGTRYIKRTA